MIKYFYILFISLNIWAETCEVRLPSSLIYTTDNSLRSFIDTTPQKHCTSKDAEELVELLREFRGKIPFQVINNKINHINIKGQASNLLAIEIYTLDQFLKDQLMLDQDIRVSDATMSTKAYLASSNFSLPSCQDCKRPGEHQAYLLSGSGDKEWVRFSVEQKISGLKVIQSIPSQATLSPQHFEQIEIFTKEPGKYVTSTNKLGFYSSVRNLGIGTFLENSFVHPKQLVRFNQPTQVQLEGPGITLRTTAIARGSGGHGDIIELENTQSKKRFMGKIIDQNIVRVEL